MQPAKCERHGGAGGKRYARTQGSSPEPAAYDATNQAGGGTNAVETTGGGRTATQAVQGKWLLHGRRR
jgi:hypothetical protein